MTDYREDARWSVYIHIVPKSITHYEYDKYYVGITKRSPKQRWNNSWGYKSQEFEKPISKFGWDNIEHHVIASHLTMDEACKLEKDLIKILDAYGQHGYNQSPGGENMLRGGSPYSKPVYFFDKFGNYIKKYNCMLDAIEDNHKQGLSSMIHNYKYYNNYICVYDDEVWNSNGQYTLKENWHKWIKESRPLIYQFSLDGEFIAIYFNAIEASKATHVSQSQILIQIKESPAFNFKTKYIFVKEDKVIRIGDTYYLETEIINKKRRTCVFLFDNNLVFQKKYESVSEAALDTHLSPSNIFLRTKTKSCIPNRSNCIWVFEDNVQFDGESYSIVDSSNRCANTNHHTVYQFDSNYNYLNKYRTAKEAHDSNPCYSEYAIIKSARKKTLKTKKGYFWRYEEDVYFENNTYHMIDVKQRKEA